MWTRQMEGDLGVLFTRASCTGLNEEDSIKVNAALNSF